jgi:hypothetical protein
MILGPEFFDETEEVFLVKLFVDVMSAIIDHVAFECLDLVLGVLR